MKAMTHDHFVCGGGVSSAPPEPSCIPLESHPSVRIVKHLATEGFDQSYGEAVLAI